LPVAFMGGIVGRFMNSFGLTMAFAILVSLFVSFTLTPSLCARWLKAGAGSAARNGEAFASEHEHEQEASPEHPPTWVDSFYQPIDRAYTWLLTQAMKRRWAVLPRCAPPPAH